MEIGLPDFPVQLSLESVTLVSAIQTAYIAWQLRKKWVARTAMTRALRTKFEKTLSVYKRSITFYPVFLVILWTSGLFFSKELASFLGFGYTIGRSMCSCGQSKPAKLWHFLGYYKAVVSVLLLSLTGILGLLQVILDPYIDFNHCATDIDHFVGCLYGDTKPSSYFF